MRSVVLSLLAFACVGQPQDGLPPRPAPLAPLPPPGHVETERFRDAEACGQCHLVDDATTVLHDAGGNNVAPVRLWRSSLMANAVRDPYYLAVFAEEIARAPASKDATEALCSRCHAPAGAEELAGQGQHLTFDDMTAGSGSAALLARGGVTCTACHQIDPANLGDDSSFSGKFVVGYQRKLYGRYSDPLTNPMMLIVNYTPTYGTHIESSALCGVCHTVLVPTAGGEVVEQATFLEWRSSQYATKNQPCQSCHVPPTDDAGAPISTVVASFPNTLAPRTPVGRHSFVGGNSYILSLLADAVDWAGSGIPADELVASAARDVAHLQTAARVTLPDVHREGDVLVATVHVANQTGHKLPTGYPSRRMWLHVKVSAGGQALFESGALDAKGTLAPQPHRDVITTPDQVQIWESILVDAQGKPTHRALDARRYGKDDRILPAGFSPATSSDRARTAPVGADGDATFVPGSDDVTYRLSGIPAGATIDVELLYQALRPEIIDEVDASRTPAATRFVDLAHARPVAPVTMATATATAP